MRKVLILTASTGDGHNQAAESLADAFVNNGYTAVRYDFLKVSSPLWNAFVVGGYKLLAASFPRIYGLLYKVTNFIGFNKIIPSILIRKVEKGVMDQISKYKPDVIIGTHAFAVTVISKLKKKNLIDLPFISIVTDFKAHCSYFDKEVDAYITGSAYTRYNMIRRNVPNHKVFSFGIPIRKDFLSGRKIKNGNEGEYFNILLMGGGMGLKFMNPVLKELMLNPHKLNIVVVCGNNTHLKRALERKYDRSIQDKNIQILGFTRNIPELMDDAHVVITKPGGLTVSEAIAKGVPMLLPYAIPGQEKENMDFLFSSGAAIDVSNLHYLNEVLNSLIEKPERMNEMRRKLNRIFKDYSIEHIVKLSNNLILNYKNEYQESIYKREA